MQMYRLHHFIAATVGPLFLVALSSLSGPLQAQSQWIDRQGARLVIGQPSFTRQAPISSRETLGGAAGVAYGGDILVVADGNRVGSQPVNNRVLIYRNVSTVIPRPDAELEQNSLCPACVGLPDVVLGQQDFDSFCARRHSGIPEPHGRGHRRHSDRCGGHE